MGRLPKAVQNGDGTISARIRMPESLWRFAEEVGRYNNPKNTTPGHTGIYSILDEIAARIEAGDTSFLGAVSFKKALERLQTTNMGVIKRGLANIDINKLHRTPKLKSGYVGVYASGQGFRAMGRNASGQLESIANCPTAEEAAHRRMLYYQTNGLAYGELEEEMERWRKDSGFGAQGLTDDELIKQIDQHLIDTGRWHQIYGEGTCSMRPKGVEPPKEIPKPGPPRIIGLDDDDMPEFPS